MTHIYQKNYGKERRNIFFKEKKREKIFCREKRDKKIFCKEKKREKREKKYIKKGILKCQKKEKR